MQKFEAIITEIFKADDSVSCTIFEKVDSWMQAEQWCKNNETDELEYKIRYVQDEKTKIVYKSIMDFSIDILKG